MVLSNKSSLYGFFGGRWVLLLVGLLIYTKSGNVTPGLLLAAVLFHTAYSLSYLFKMGQKAAITASAVDIGFGTYLLWLTGGLSSPFLIYCFTGLLMVKRFVTWRRYYTISFGYALFLPMIFAATSEHAAYMYLLNHFDYSFIVLGYFCLISFAHYTIQAVRKQYRKLVMIYSSRFMARQPRNQGSIPYLEGLLKKVLDEREVILCMESDRQNEKVHSWKHTYFTNYMKQNASMKGQRMYAKLPSPTGELESLYIQILLNRSGESYGWLLVKAEKNELSILHKIYIQFILMRLEAIHFSDEELREAEEAAVAIERNMIAQNIHDGITQELFFISIQLFQLKNALPAHAREEMLPYVTEVEKKVKESHRNIRQFIIELKDEKRTINLHYAIDKLLHRMTENTGVKPIFEHIGWVSQEQVDIEGAIYHLVEEAANNVIKHAKAKHIHVTIEVTSVQWTVMIKDDGIGMKTVDKHQEGRLGLGGMEGRIRALNGTISFQSGEAAGTTVTACIPRERSTAYV